MVTPRPGFLRRLLFRLRESAPMRSANLRGDPRHCGLLDMVHSGWLDAAAGTLFEGFDVGPGDTVLDAGCGNGLAASFCAQRGAAVRCCDLDAAKLRGLASTLRERGTGDHVAFVASAQAIPLADASVTRVIATEVLEHVAEPALVVRELARVGRPGAKYLFSVPDAASEGFQRPFAHPSYFMEPNHVHVIEAAELEQWLGEAGLVAERRGQWGFYWFLWMCFYWSTGQGAGGAVAAATMDRIEPPYHPLLESWAETWTRFLELPGSARMLEALNELMPKARVVVARRP